MASPAYLHLFVITFFIAFVAPFGSFFVTGLKRAYRHETLGHTMYRGGVSDRLDCLLITGLFFMLYINSIIYQPINSMERLKELVTQMSPAAQQELLARMRASMEL